MRILLVGVFSMVMVAGCPDVAPVPTTVVHIGVSSSCETPGCEPTPFEYYCGPVGEDEVTPETRRIEVSSDYDAKDIAGYVQLQYDLGDGRSRYTDRLLQIDDTAGVAAVYTSDFLYSLTLTGEPIDIATDKLLSREGSTLIFAYDYAPQSLSVVERHEIAPQTVVHVEANIPGVTDGACCSAGHAQDGALLGLALVGGLRLGRRRSRRPAAG